MKKIFAFLPFALLTILGGLVSGCTPSHVNKSIGRGFYVPPSLATSENAAKVVAQLIDANLDALVIDVKGASGEIYLPGASAIHGVTTAPMNEEIDLKTLLIAKRYGIRLIARIVLFLDPCFGRKNPALVIRNKDGTPLHTNEPSRCGPITYLSPYMKEVWDYNIQVAQLAAQVGFDEIQLDYVRFPDEPLNSLLLPGLPAGGEDRIAAVTAGVALVRAALPPSIALSADVFGCVAVGPYDLIGQDAVKLAPNLDYISPMLYPSLWPPGSLGVKDPDSTPYDIIYKSVAHLKALYSPLPYSPKIRPWIEIGEWPPLHYGKKEVEAQVRALSDHNISGWLLWQASGKYAPDALP